jgi:hypothetical protein
MSDVHVVPSGQGWAVEVDGQKRDTYDTQDEAIIRGRGVADGEGGELVIHGEDGSIRQKDSHGNDPRDIPG